MTVTLLTLGYLAMMVYAHRYLLQWFGAWYYWDRDRQEFWFNDRQEFWFNFGVALIFACLGAWVLTPALLVWNYILRPLGWVGNRVLPRGVGKYVQAFYTVDRMRRKELLRK